MILQSLWWGINIRDRAFQRELLERFSFFLEEVGRLVDVVIVEGQRDVEALRVLGFTGKIVSCAQLGVSDSELVSNIASEYGNVLLLTDFDDEGLTMNQKLTRLFEAQGLKVEIGLRREFRGFMARLGVYAIESLDNVKDSVAVG